MRHCVAIGACVLVRAAIVSAEATMVQFGMPNYSNYWSKFNAWIQGANRNFAGFA